MASLNDSYWQKFDPVDSMMDQVMAPVFSKPVRPVMPSLNLGGMPPSLQGMPAEPTTQGSAPKGLGLNLGAVSKQNDQPAPQHPKIPKLGGLGGLGNLKQEQET